LSLASFYEPSLMFSGKAEAYPRVEVTERRFTWVSSWHCPQTLDLAVKA
jgi:hypothetical protein